MGRLSRCPRNVRGRSRHGGIERNLMSMPRAHVLALFTALFGCDTVHQVGVVHGGNDASDGAASLGDAGGAPPHGPPADGAAPASRTLTARRCGSFARSLDVTALAYADDGGLLAAGF